MCVSLPNHYFCVNFIKTYSSHTLPFPLEVMLLPRPLLDAFTSLTFCSCCPSVLFVLTCAHLFVMSRRCDNDQEVQKYKNGELESTREYNPGESHLVFSSLSLSRRTSSLPVFPCLLLVSSFLPLSLSLSCPRTHSLLHFPPFFPFSPSLSPPSNSAPCDPRAISALCQAPLTSPFPPPSAGKDWSELEAPGHQSAVDADMAADEARKYVAEVTERAKVRVHLESLPSGDFVPCL